MCVHEVRRILCFVWIRLNLLKSRLELFSRASRYEICYRLQARTYLPLCADRALPCSGSNPVLPGSAAPSAPIKYCSVLEMDTKPGRRLLCLPKDARHQVLSAAKSQQHVAVMWCTALGGSGCRIPECLSCFYPLFCGMREGDFFLIKIR